MPRGVERTLERREAALMGVLMGDATGDAAGEAMGEDSTELRTDDMAEDSVSSSNMKLRGLAAFAIVVYWLYLKRDAIEAFCFSGWLYCCCFYWLPSKLLTGQGNSTDIMITFIFFYMKTKKGGG